MCSVLCPMTTDSNITVDLFMGEWALSGLIWILPWEICLNPDAVKITSQQLSACLSGSKDPIKVLAAVRIQSESRGLCWLELGLEAVIVSPCVYILPPWDVWIVWMIDIPWFIICSMQKVFFSRDELENQCVEAGALDRCVTHLKSDVGDQTLHPITDAQLLVRLLFIMTGKYKV